MPTLSIVTVAWNEESRLPGLFESLRFQTDRDFSFVVVDGGSKDETVRLLQGASDLITHFISEPDFGFYDALNKAIRLVDTDYYLVVGADDKLAPDAVANYKAAAAESNADMVIANVVAGNTVRAGYHPEKRWLGPPAMFTSHSVGTLIRTALHETFGCYSMNYPVFSDSLFMKRVAVSPGTRVVCGDFIAGNFCITGFSSANVVRSICELWMLQRESGENPLIQYLLFQARILRHLGSVAAR
jgi:glycosyltransferase involved in cell wall biosynthesis